MRRTIKFALALCAMASGPALGQTISPPPGAGVGGVTSVGVTPPSGIMSATAPVTSSGNVALSLISQTANTFLAAPSGASGVPTFRGLVVADLPTSSAITWTGLQTIATTIATPQIQSLQINGTYNGANLFNRAVQDNSTFVSTTTGAYASYDTLATMNGSLAYNHFYGYESRRTYAGSGLLNVMVGFTTIDNVSGPINAYRSFVAGDPAISGAGSFVEQEGLYIPDLTTGSTLIAGIETLVTSGTNKYNLYINGTAPSYFNAGVTFNTGQTWINPSNTNYITTVQAAAGAWFNFATDTNIVLGGGSTVSKISSLNTASTLYEPLSFNASALVFNISGVEKMRISGTQILLEQQTVTSFPFTSISYAGSGTPTFATGAGAGTGASVSCKSTYTCDNVSGTVSLNTGTATAAGTLFTITFAGLTRANLPNCVVSGGNSTIATGMVSSTTTTAVIGSGSVPTVSFPYVLSYVCFGN